MQFEVEKTQLAVPASTRSTEEFDISRFYVAEASDVDEALRLFVRKDHARIVGEVQKFPGSQLVATVRKHNKVYMVQLCPTDNRA